MKVTGDAIANTGANQGVKRPVDTATQAQVKAAANDSDRDGDNEAKEPASAQRNESGGLVNVKA